MTVDARPASASRPRPARRSLSRGGRPGTCSAATRRKGLLPHPDPLGFSTERGRWPSLEGRHAPQQGRSRVLPDVRGCRSSPSRIPECAQTRQRPEDARCSRCSQGSQSGRRRNDSLPAGELLEKASHGLWQLDYPSEFGPQGIRLEVSIRPVLRRPREVRLRQLLTDPLAGDSRQATCFALDASEARAEKVRAAFTREAIRDFYDLARLHEAGIDFTSPSFLELVDTKLAELDAAPLAEQPRSFGLSEKRRRLLDKGMLRDLPAVLRTDAPEFDLAETLGIFDRLWRKK
jgi:hypothetical protein